MNPEIRIDFIIGNLYKKPQFIIINITKLYQLIVTYFVISEK